MFAQEIVATSKLHFDVCTLEASVLSQCARPYIQPGGCEEEDAGMGPLEGHSMAEEGPSKSLNKTFEMSLKSLLKAFRKHFRSLKDL